MLCGVPNLALTFGYTNASWTLKADLTAEYVCRLLDQLDARGLRQATPLAPDPALPTEPFIDFSSGYVTRAVADLPKQGATTPWRLHQNYLRDTGCCASPRSTMPWCCPTRAGGHGADAA